MTRGIYLNNPACIRLSNLNKWKGLSKVQKDKEFCTFDSVHYSIRALIIILRTYTYKYGLNSVRGIISRYAPVSENATELYINLVSNMIAQSDNLVLFHTRKQPSLQCYELCRAICLIESGYVLDYSFFREILSIL